MKTSDCCGETCYIPLIGFLLQFWRPTQANVFQFMKTKFWRRVMYEKSNRSTTSFSEVETQFGDHRVLRNHSSSFANRVRLKEPMPSAVGFPRAESDEVSMQARTWKAWIHRSYKEFWIARNQIAFSVFFRKIPSLIVLDCLYRCYPPFYFHLKINLLRFVIFSNYFYS